MWHEIMSCNLTQNNAGENQLMWHEMMSCNFTQNNAYDMKWCHVI